ncbi:MAG: hypothetical protein IJA60_07180 [Clostridia bacterium]|nr:hypothetical protein [Clostridia bacterium]
MKSKKWLTTRELVIFAMLGALMFVGDIAFEWAPNVHPIAMLLMVYTVAFRKKGIIPFIIYIVLQAVFFGGLWLVPYLYIFPLCWLCTLAVSEKLSRVPRQICYTVICTLFGLLFGALYAPFHVIVFMKSFSVSKMLAWIASGITFDIIHAVGNFAASFLIIPLADLLRKINKTKTA